MDDILEESECGMYQLEINCSGQYQVLTRIYYNKIVSRWDIEIFYDDEKAARLRFKLLTGECDEQD